MTAEVLRAVARVHGAFAWAAVAALLAAVVAVWRRRAIGAALATGAAALGAATFATGAVMHLPFQARLRQRLFLASAALGWLFERKEHAAFGALALSICGAVAIWGERAAGGAGEQAGRDLRRAALIAMTGALLFEVLAVGVSIAAGQRVGF